MRFNADAGGGTPTLLSEGQLETILSTLQPLVSHQEMKLKSQSKDIDPSFFSIETTPEISATEPSKLQLIFDSGVHRISVGVQTSNKNLLSRINRQSPGDYVDQSISNLRKIGFRRINLDLIFGLPEQSFDQWKADLSRVVQLDPDSITTYDCIYKGKGRGVNSLMEREHIHRPSAEMYGVMYDYAYDYLLSKGYHAPYGSVNFTKHPFETGTSSYFEKRLLRGVNYIGVGNYASTMIDRYWMFAPHSLEGWFDEISKISSIDTKWPIYNAYSLPIEERVAKYILSSLSFGYIDENYFESAFPSWFLTNFYQQTLLELVEKRKWMFYDDKQRRFYIKQGCFQYMPMIRSLFHTYRSLHWFENNVSN